MLINEPVKVKSPLAYMLTLILSGLWLLLIFIGPALFNFPQKYNSIGDVYYYLFHFTCHQMPERCYWILGYQLPVCVRCLGIYLGIFLGLLVYPLIKDVKSLKLPSKWFLICCFIPLGVDGISQTLHLYPSPHWVRLLTGIICGSVAMFYVIPGLNELFNTIAGDSDD